MSFTRRGILAGGATALVLSANDRAFGRQFAGALRPLDGAAGFAARPVGREGLWLKRTDGEEIVARFRHEGGYDRGAIMQMSWFMRDIADNNRAVWMEPRLLDLLAGVQTGMSQVNGAPVPLVVTSGYRTPAHNARVETAARNSMHLYGYAADVYVPGFAPDAVALAASFFASGGIGSYDTFTHLDVWKVRTWSGARTGQQTGSRMAAPVTASKGG